MNTSKKQLCTTCLPAFPDGWVVKNLPVKQETWAQSLGQQYPLKKEIATHSCVLTCEIPWTGEPGGLQSMGSQKSQTTERLKSNSSSCNEMHVLANLQSPVGWKGEGISRDLGRDVYTLLYFKWVTQQGPTAWHSELCSMLHGSLDGRGLRGRMDTCMYMYGWVPLPSTWNQHNLVKQLCCLAAKSCLTLFHPMDCSPRGSCLWDFPGKNTGVGCHFLLQRIFQTHRSNPHLLHWQVDSLLLNHLGSLIISYTPI